MSLVVEDGTCVADAESYISVADASTYHTARGNAAWAAVASDTIREQLLRKAAQFMQEEYRGRWKGSRTLGSQSLDWPRQSVRIDDAPIPYFLATNTIPKEVKQACAELALRAISADLAPDLAQQKLSESVSGAIAITYDRTSPQSKRYQAVEKLLAPYFGGSASLYRVERA